MFDDLLEVTLEPAHTHIPGLCVLLNGDWLVVVLIEIAAGVLHFLLDVGGYGRPLLQTGSLDQQEDLLEIHGQQFLITDAAGLEFVDHFLK